MNNNTQNEVNGICLGIESSADDFGVGIATFDGGILANESDCYIPTEGGIHPREAARHHAEVADKVLQGALSKADIKASDLTCVAFSQGPGLGPSLRTGATVARALASYLEVPLIGINHSVAHIEIGKLQTGATDPVTLYAQGGNTMVTATSRGATVFSAFPDIALHCLCVRKGSRVSIRRPLGAAVEQLA